ncbi:unnamed protein product, partial [Closterium sp. Naga37s-1]
MSGFSSAAARTQEAVHLRHPASTLSRNPSTATTGWMHRSFCRLPQAAASPAALVPSAHPSPGVTSATRSKLCDSAACPPQTPSRAVDESRPLALDSPKTLSIAGASRWLSVAGGQTGLGMGTGGVRRRSAVNGAGGGGDDGSETDGQGGELPPAAVAVEGEASGDVADAADTCECFFPLLTPLAATSPPVACHDPSSPITHPPPGTLWDTSPSAPNHSPSAPNPPASPFQSPANPPAPPATIAPYLATVQGPADAAHHRHLYAAHHRHLYAAHHRHLYAAHHRHLYAARGVVYQWLGDPALRAVRRRRVAPGEARGEGERVGARGELHLSRVAKERKRALLGRRYNTHRDELTIVSE